MKKLTLDQRATYQIKVPGVLDEWQPDWGGEMDVTVESGGEGLPVTTVTVRVDQAALHGLLRHLYSLGLPLISIVCVEVNENLMT